MTKTWSWTLCLALLAALAGAEEKPAPAGPAGKMTPLKVQFLFTRYQGEKKVASLPYTLWVTSDDPPTHLRQGVGVPVPVKDTFDYRNVGMNIDCSVKAVEDGRFKVDATVEHSSVFPQEGTGKPQGWTPVSPLSGPPLLGSFYSSFHVLLRDGQTAQYVSVTDPVTGEVMKVDLTLSVIR